MRRESHNGPPLALLPSPITCYSLFVSNKPPRIFPPSLFCLQGSFSRLNLLPVGQVRLIQCLTDCLRSVGDALAAAGIPEGTAYQKVTILVCNRSALLEKPQSLCCSPDLQISEQRIRMVKKECVGTMCLGCLTSPRGKVMLSAHRKSKAARVWVD